MKPNPHLTYEGLWKLARPDEKCPQRGKNWYMTWDDAVVWLTKWQIPGLAIDIHNNVICTYNPPRPNTNIHHAQFNILMHNIGMIIFKIKLYGYDLQVT